MSDWNWLNRIGGAVDWSTGGYTDFDGKGSEGGYTWWGGEQKDPIFGGADKTWGSGPDTAKGFDFLDAYDSFKSGMQKLNDNGIPCFKYIVSAKSDSEMVYRGILTMIKDY